VQPVLSDCESLLRGVTVRRTLAAGRAEGRGVGFRPGHDGVSGNEEVGGATGFVERKVPLESRNTTEDAAADGK
jgi:hypothetical protein